MAGSTSNSNYLAGKFFVGLFALIAAVLLGNIARELHLGIVQHKTGGVLLLADDPHGFWIDICIQAAIALFFGWQSYRLRRFARRDPALD